MHISIYALVPLVPNMLPWKMINHISRVKFLHYSKVTHAELDTYIHGPSDGVGADQVLANAIKATIIQLTRGGASMGASL